MYERFYQLRNRPFALSPDPDFLYPSRVHREALDYLRFGIDTAAGFVVLTGEIGSGKTTLLQVLLRRLDGQTTVIRLVNTLLTGPELLESILLDLGVEHPPASKPAMLRELARLLIEQRDAGKRVVTVIDEAQNLSLDALEELRMLSNLETEQSKLIQIVLVGQPDLRDSLERPALEQLRQRVTVRYHIGPLDADETARYVNHRLKRAAQAAPLEFPRDVTDLIHARSRGVPRLINVICDAVLLVGYAEDSRVIHRALAQEAIPELESSGVLRRADTPAAAQAVQGTGAHLHTPGEAAPAASRPAPPAPSRIDDSLRPPAAAPTVADWPLRPAAVFVRTADPQRDGVRVQARPTSQPSPASQASQAFVAPMHPMPPRVSVPAATSRRAQPAGGWTWLKAVVFGLGPETGRR